jgi:hypothetical protein
MSNMRVFVTGGAGYIGLHTLIPSPVWGEIRNFVIENSELEAWSAPLQSKDGQTLALKVSLLASGASLIALTPEAPSGAASNSAVA